MRLSREACRDLLAAGEHAVLATLHPQRGIDAVPVVYVADEDGFVGVPVDTVKPKAVSRLQRERNLEADPRATLLVERWDRDDWSRLWWVRAALRWAPDEPAARADALAAGLAARFEQYADRPFTRLIVLQVEGLVGWSASPLR